MSFIKAVITFFLTVICLALAVGLMVVLTVAAPILWILGIAVIIAVGTYQETKKKKGR